MDRFLGFLTPARRKAIYMAVAAAAFVLTAFGVVTQDQLSGWVQNVSGLVALFTTLMAALNTNTEA